VVYVNLDTGVNNNPILTTTWRRDWFSIMPRWMQCHRACILSALYYENNIWKNVLNSITANTTKIVQISRDTTATVTLAF